MKKLLRDIFSIASKDFESKQIDVPCILLAVGMLILAAFSVFSGMENFLIGNQLSWYIFPLSVGAMVALPAGGAIMRSERDTKMVDVILASGVHPLAFILGKAAKPYMWGTMVSLLTTLATQVCFAIVGSSYFLYPLSIPFFICLIIVPLTAALLTIGFAIAYTNETFIGVVIFAITLAPLIAVSFIGFQARLDSLVLISCILIVVYLLLIVVSTMISLFLLRPGSRYRVTNS